MYNLENRNINLDGFASPKLQPQDSASKVHHGLVVTNRLVVSGGDGPKVLESAEQVLNKVT